MGLLDEAIREHLELKRRSGADPSAIARDEREALASVLADDVELGPDENVPDRLEVVEIPPVAVTPAQQHAVGDAIASFSTVGQETAELDMQALMEEDPDAADGAAPEGPIVDPPTNAQYSGEGSGADAAEWRSRAELDGEPPPEQLPGQERLTFD